MQSDMPGIPLLARGKVRDIYDLDDMLLIVATDRISAFDCVMPNGIPGKGKILTEMSLFWFDYTRDIVPNHLVASDVDDFPAELRRFREQLEGRSMLVKKAERIDVECIVRGYISGGGWREYQKLGSICGIELPTGMLECQKLPDSIFTPSTKAEEGHDENVSYEEIAAMLGAERAEELRGLSLAIYEKARSYAETKGIIIADTKFEFGRLDGKTILIDEILSPDSSRFWPMKDYEPGKSQPSFDKEFLREYLNGLEWDKTPPAPELPGEIVVKTLAKYREACNLLMN